MPANKTASVSNKSSLISPENSQPAESLTIKEKVVKSRSRFFYGRLLAFAFNSNSIEMATVLRYGRKVKLLDIRKVYIPEENRTDQDKSSFICRVIEEYYQELGKKCKKIIVSASGQETVFRTVTLPRMKKKELKAALEFEIKKQIPFPLEECYYNYRPIARITKNGREYLKLSVHAISQRYVREILTPFRNLNLKVTCLYNTQDVIGELLSRLPFFRKDTNYALLNISKNNSQISYYCGSTLEFTHVSSLGSSLLSHRFDDAKFENFTELLADEIQNSLDYYTGQYSSHFTNRVFIYGDMSYADELIALLSNRFGFEFSRFPAENLDFCQDKEDELSYSLPVSLAVIAAASSTTRLANLLPPEQLLEQRKKIIDRVGRLGLISLAALFFYNSYIDRARLKIDQTFLSDLEQKIAAYENSQAYDTYNILKRRIAVDKLYLEKIKEKSSYLGLNLKELSLLTPATIRLYNFEYNPTLPENNIILYGVVNTVEVPPELVLAEYVETLNHSPFFDHVKVTRHIKNLTKTGFELDFQISLQGII